MGVRVDFEANDESLLAAVKRWLGAGSVSSIRDVAAPRTAGAELVRVPRVRLLLAKEGMPAVDPPVFQTPGPNVLVIRGPGFKGHADAANLTAGCSLVPELLDARKSFEESVVATLTLFLVTRLDRQPFHAAALARDGRGVLLAGPSGAGKSTIALAARTQGWSVLSDDAVYLQSEPRLRIWTRPSNLHLPPEAARWFPELAALELVVRANGKRKHLVENGCDADPWPLDHGVLCLLDPAAGEPGLHPITAKRAVASVLRKLDPGFDAFHHTIGPVLQAVADQGVWVLRTGDDPRLAARLLDRLPWFT